MNQIWSWVLDNPVVHHCRGFILLRRKKSVTTTEELSCTYFLKESKNLGQYWKFLKIIRIWVLRVSYNLHAYSFLVNMSKRKVFWSLSNVQGRVMIQETSESKVKITLGTRASKFKWKDFFPSLFFSFYYFLALVPRVGKNICLSKWIVS